MEELNVFLRTDPTYHELIKPRQTENRKARSSKEADKWQEKRDGQLNELMDQVRKLAKSLPRMSQDDAVVALLSKYVTFEEKFTNAADTAIDKVMNGTYLNSLNDLEDSFVPLVSIMQLLNYAKSKPDNALRNALLDFIEKDTLACFKGYPFEAFHAHWERVIHECYRVQRVRKLSLKDYYLDGK
jgi:hypothetical protein